MVDAVWPRPSSQGGYETEANLAPLLAEAQAIGPVAGRAADQPGPGPPGRGGRGVGAVWPTAGDRRGCRRRPAPKPCSACPNVVGQEYRGRGPPVSTATRLAVAFAEPPTPRTSMRWPARIGCRVTPVLGDPVVIRDRLNGVTPPAPPGTGARLAPGRRQSPVIQRSRRRVRGRASARDGIIAAAPTTIFPSTWTTCCGMR